MNLNLQDTTVLVTGSTGGIGQEIASSFARENATVIINGRSEKSVKAATKAIKKAVPDAKLLPLTADISTKDGCNITIEFYPDIDVLVNNWAFMKR